MVRIRERAASYQLALVGLFAILARNAHALHAGRSCPITPGERGPACYACALDAAARDLRPIVDVLRGR